AQRAASKQSFLVHGGSDRLPKALAAKLAERIHYGCPVHRIEHDATGVKAICRQAGSHRIFEAEQLICTLPFSVLGRVEFSPRLSPEKQRAIAELAYTSVARIFLQTSSKFWAAEGLSGTALTDMPQMALFEKMQSNRGPRGMLENYTAGAQARTVTAMLAEERVGWALAQASAVHPAIAEHFERGASKCWDEDEWARGAYPWFRPGTMTELLPHLGRAEGKVHFAGDVTSSHPGWMQGALASGVRAAAEVNGGRARTGLR
ncbi:MAG: FAD-dependent oxidoreductase, partial [Thermoanaerobaculia bacterium]|nr:FAD-dependent oxidoreductase [Thermoanaerobaculia bacterium]